MEEEDTFLVIIGDSEDESPLESCVPIKLESMDEPELETIVEIIETSVNEEQDNMKLEPEYDEYEYLEEDEAQIEKLEPCKSTDINESDEEYIPDGYIPSLKSVNATNSSHRRQMLKPELHKSFVAELRDKYPELAEDDALLVQILGEIMRNVKAPTPPKGSYVHRDHAYECSHCGAYADTLPAVEKHYNEKHGPRYLVCYACGVDFRSTTNLYKHEKRCSARDARVVLRARAWHIGSKGRGRPCALVPPPAPPATSQGRYSCTQCSASFVSKMTLLAHQNLHDGVKPFQCHVCPAAYTSYSVLSRHVKKHSLERFICDVCGRAFTVKAALSTHMDTHRPFRKYGCEQCERRFAQKSALKLHVDRVHKKLPQPFACDVCDKRCARMSLLKLHMQKEHGLLIMTRKMFFRNLPNMTEEEMKRAVKVVLKSRVEYDDDVQSKGKYGNTNRDNNKVLKKGTVRRKDKKKSAKNRHTEQFGNDERIEELYMEENDIPNLLPESTSMKEFIKYLRLEDKLGDKRDNLFVGENDNELDAKDTEEGITYMLLSNVECELENETV